VHSGFWWGNLKERDHLEESGIEERMILKGIFRKWDGGMDWIDLAQDRERWRALVNVAMNIWVSQNTGYFLTNREPVTFSRTTPWSE
jgi:hypothetical protein